MRCNYYYHYYYHYYYYCCYWYYIFIREYQITLSYNHIFALSSNLEDLPQPFFFDPGTSVNAFDIFAHLQSNNSEYLFPSVALYPNVFLTHKCLLKSFPYPFNISYYDKWLQANTISLENIQRLGVWYGIDPLNNNDSLVKDSITGSTIGQALLS